MNHPASPRHTRRFRILRRWAPAAPVAVAAIVLLWMIAHVQSDASLGGTEGLDGSSTGPAITPEIVDLVLASRPPERPTMSDEIEYFEARLASSDGDDHVLEPRLVSAYVQRFRAYGDSADASAALRHFQVLRERGPSTPSLLSLESSLRLLFHDFPGAVRSAVTANEQRRSYDSALRLRLFDALWASGAYGEANDLLQLPHDRGSFGFLVREARVLDRLGETAQARDRIGRALEEARAYAQPRGIVAWAMTELGHLEHHSGHPRAATDRLLEALEILPGSPAAIEELARIAWESDRNPKLARPLFARALDTGDHLSLYRDLADVSNELGDAEAAEALRRRFVERATASPEIERQYLRPLALMFADEEPSDRLDDAQRFAERDLAMRPTSESWDTLAWVRYRQGDLDAALAASRNATEWGVPEPIVLFHAGVIADDAGERERAGELLTAARSRSSELRLAALEEIDRRLGF